MTSDKGDLRLIGQFGVGFYSAFIVASRVDVISRRAGSDEAYKWSSDGTGTFTIAPVDLTEAPQRGTRIVLHLKDDALEFLEDWKLESVVRAYSDHIAHPIMLAIGKETARQINAASAIWMRPKADVTRRPAQGILRGVDWAFPRRRRSRLHYRAEGRHEYTVLLYVPGEKPFDLYDPERRGHQKLYVKRVFITADAELLPPYLRFVRGVIDSEDMPLNLSREMLQNNPQVAQIRKAVTNKVLAELKKCAETEPERFAKIWEAFGPVIKEGLYEDMERRDQLFEIARFRTTKRDSVTLKDYVADLKPNQTAIYYLTAEEAAKAAASPQLEGYKARDVEVLLADRSGRRLLGPHRARLRRQALQLDHARVPPISTPSRSSKSSAAGETDDAATGTLIALIKQTLGPAVKDVRKSARLTTSAVCLVNDTGFDRTLERLLSRQKTTGVSVSAPVLEINPRHPAIIALAKAAKAKGASPELEDAARLLLDQAHVLEGEPVGDAAAFSKRMTEMMQKAFAV